MKLYELTSSYNQLLDMADNLDEQTLLDTLGSIQEEIDVKAENIGKLIRSLEAETVAIGEEIDRLQRMKKARQNQIKSVKGYLESEMQKIGKKKIKTSLFSIRIQNNPRSVNVLNERLIDKRYFVEQQPKIDKRALLNDLKEGKHIEGVEIVQTESIRIQ